MNIVLGVIFLCAISHFSVKSSPIDERLSHMRANPSVRGVEVPKQENINELINTLANEVTPQPGRPLELQETMNKFFKMSNQVTSMPGTMTRPAGAIPEQETIRDMFNTLTQQRAAQRTPTDQGSITPDQETMRQKPETFSRPVISTPERAPGMTSYGRESLTPDQETMHQMPKTFSSPVISTPERAAGMTSYRRVSLTPEKMSELESPIVKNALSDQMVADKLVPKEDVVMNVFVYKDNYRYLKTFMIIGMLLFFFLCIIPVPVF